MGLFIDRTGDPRFGSIISVGAIVLTGLIGGCGLITNSWEVYKGERTGMINKVSKKGYFWKTYECQMALEGVSGSGTSIGANIWNFSIDNQRKHGENIDDLAAQMSKYMDSSAKVKVKYLEVASGWPWRGSTDYFVQGTELVGVMQGKKGTTQSNLEGSVTSGTIQTPSRTEITLDGRTYILRHNNEGKLKVTELKEVQ